ncbi:MAG TPA: TonB-dependent receptor plug domain-containing protein [Steroidobacteraceae bacterium]|nr:TonB-dependent receptor plug domain-containing protein [Steroidobacteraceae bacterium]
MTRSVIGSRSIGAAALSLCAAAAAADNAPSTIGELKQLNLEDLMNVQVTSVARHPEKLIDAASAIQVITQEDIRRSGATSIPEALRLADNLQVAQKNSHDWAISARGFNTALANKLLVMIDGRTVYTPLFSGVFWDVQDYVLADIDRIEVISGPGGALWGANAVNGVINIITKSAKDTQGLYADAGGGSRPQDFTDVRYGGALGPESQFRVYGKYFDRGSEVLANGDSASDSWRQGRGGFRVDSQASAQDQLTLQGDFYDGRENDQTGGTSDTGGGNVLGRWSRRLSDDSDLSLQSYIDRTHLTDPVAPLLVNGLQFAGAGVLTDDLTTYDVDFQHRFRAGSVNNVVWGFGFRYTHDVVSNAPALAFLPPTLNRDLYSVFAQDEIALRRDLSLTLGTKVERNDYTGFEFEPDARLSWILSSQQALWAAISRAVRTPSRIDQDLSEAAPPHPVLLEGGADFTSESVLAYELGYRAQISSRMTASVSSFFNHYDDIRSTDFTPKTIIPLFFANGLEGDTYGLEFSGNYQVSQMWSLHAGYTLLEEHLHVKPGQTDLNDALNETADPEHQFSLRSSLNLPRHAELDAALRWVDTLRNNNGPLPGSVPSYFELDTHLAWHASDRLELSLVGQNLLHNRHVEYGFPGPTRPEIERTAYGKLTWRF